MSLALYRKYRPKNFDEIIGQDAIKKVLLHAVAEKKPSHAYLFSGTRGTGKTTTARVFAHALSIESHDIIELDAASHRGIENIRELRDGVSALPFSSPYKMYIIDEVHMLTKESFNALLKTLEEPPAHVIFILATTEPERLPDTILSRCQIFHFQQPSLQTLSDMAIRVAEQEGFTLSSEGAELIALLGDGSFRDMQSHLQKVLASTQGKTVSGDDVTQATGTPSLQLLHDFLNSYAVSDIPKCLDLLGNLVKQNYDSLLFLRMLINNIRIILLFRFAPQHEVLSTLSEERKDFYKKLSGKDGAVINADFLRNVLESYITSLRSPLRHMALEMLLLQQAEKLSQK